MIRKFSLCAFILFILASCQGNNKKDEEPASLKSEKAEYKAKADIRFDSHAVAESHRTVITEKYNESTKLQSSVSE